MADTVAEKIVQPAVNAEHLAYCPSMDLISLATIDEKVHIFRLNGQEVFSIKDRQSDTKVARIAWKPNGQSLAVAFNNHTLHLASSRTGKTVHRVNCSSYSDAPVCCLGWGVNVVNKETLRSQLSTLEDNLDLGDALGQTQVSKALNPPPDLPQTLAFVDVEGVLPKLSPLSSGGIEDDIFSSRASLDTVFRPLTKDSGNSADVLILGFEDGTIHLSIYDFFPIGTFAIRKAFGAPVECRPLLHSYHPFSTTHSLLVSSSTESGHEISLLSLDLRLLSKAGTYLLKLASKSTQMQNLLRYIHQVQIQISGDFKASLELPGRFIANIEETLNEKGEWSWTQAAYHLAVTGNCPDDIKEWLVDQLGERGHKRWDKAIVTGYESVRRLTHEHLLPALERFVVMASHLRGLSRFQVSNQHLGLSSQDMDNVIDTLSCLQLVAHQILIICGNELRQFQAFSVWLRQEIDTQASEDNESETQEGSTNVDHYKTLQYIQGPMKRSRLLECLQIFDEPGDLKSWDLAAEGGSLFELYQAETKRRNENIEVTKQLPRLDALLGHLDKQCAKIYSSIAETQRRNTRLGRPVVLAKGQPQPLDMRMLCKNTEPNDNFTQFVALRDTAHKILLYRIGVAIENGMSSIDQIERAIVDLGEWQLQDLKFMDDEEMIIAVSQEDSSRLLIVNYLKTTDSSNGILYENNGFGNRASSLDLSIAGKIEQHTWIKMPGGVSWTPQKLEVNGRKGRRVACVLAQDNFHYRVYDIDSRDKVLDSQDEMSDTME